MSTIRDERHRRLDELSVRAARAYVDSGLHGTAAEVVLALDVSDAMLAHYTSGLMNELTTALLALAMKFDDNGRVPVWAFGLDATHVGEIKKNDHRGWTDRELRPGGAPKPRLGPLIDAVGRRYFPLEWDEPPRRVQTGGKLKRVQLEHATVREPRPCPVFVIAVTSGACDDALEATQLLRKASHLPIFWQFAGVGDDDFRFLKGFNTLAETWVDACGFFIPEIGVVDPRTAPKAGPSGLVRRPRFDIDEERLYTGLLNELPRWLDHERVKAMLIPPAQPDDDTADDLDGLVLALPEKELARRERERLEREERRKRRAAEAEAELSRAESWPTIRAEAELEEPDAPDELVPEAQARERDGRRKMPDTRPYQPDDGPRPETKRRATVAFDASALSAPAEDAERDDENTVETATERLARIRARRNARNAGT